MDDIFCKSGTHIIRGLAEDKPVEEILKGIPSGKIRKSKTRSDQHLPMN